MSETITQTQATGQTPGGVTPNSKPDDKASKGDKGGSKEMTAAQAAKLVKRPVYGPIKTGKLDADGKDEFVIGLQKRAPVQADEVLAFKDYGDHVVVVTKDGQKFSSADDVEGT